MTDPQENRTELEEFGEFGLIQHLTKPIKLHHKESIKGVGDDAAVIDTGKELTLVSTDMLTEGVHFDLMYVPLKHLGYKAVAVNLSDIYAMNGTPKQITVSIAVSNRFSVEALEELYSGMLKACEAYQVDLIGGDTTSSLSGLTISVTAMGTVSKEKVTYRNGAKENELVCVSGDLGAAYVGLQLLEREKQIFSDNSLVQPDLEGKDYVLERQLKPEARIQAVKVLDDVDIQPTAMIDVSDGLASELIHITSQSGKGVQIYEDKIPIDPATIMAAEELGLDPTMAALNGGEDYELLFTIKPDDYDKIKDIEGLHVIGHITDANAGCHLVTKAGTLVSLKAQGWNAFGERNEG
ncbi:thiamine-phosphate kinase [bacterium SCSIO 12741]|nr:thiamine-phosphate kinase [bacterium SCSIO 12741]